jgi:lysophospholipase L1-like esterase
MLTGDWKLETGGWRMAGMTKLQVTFGFILAVGISIGFCGQVGAQATTATTAPSAAPEPVPQPADVPAPKLTADGRMNPRFEQLHNSFLARRSEGPIGVLFLGDSITEGWNGPGRAVWLKYYAPMDAANFGIGGDQTQHVLWRIANGELDGIDPKVVVLLIGTNNIGYPQEDILGADEAIVQRIHEKLPNTRVLVLGIFPRGRNPQDPLTADMRDKIKFVNAGLAKFDDGDKTRFLDIGDKFMQADGTLPPQIMPDALHPNAAGYQIWADAMNELLGDMMAGRGAQPVGH